MAVKENKASQFKFIYPLLAEYCSDLVQDCCIGRKKIFLKIVLQLFGNIKKKITSLHRKQIKSNMLRIQLHIESANWCSLDKGYTDCGASCTRE